MNDQNSQFQAILTAVGEAKQANADALGIPWTFAQMAVGDANGTDPIPDRLQTKLINERRRAPLNQLKPDPKNPGVIIAEQVIPENIGGFWIRELGLYDQDGDLVAVANCPGTYKPLTTQGSGRTQIIRMNLIVSSLANVVLKIDPSVVLATREYVDSKTFASLKEKPTTIAGYGITDAYDKSEVNIFLSGKAAKATTLAGYNISDAYTQSEINQFLSGKAAKATTLAGYGITDAYNSTAVDNALENKANKSTTLGGYGIDDAYTKSEINQFLSGKATKATTLAGYAISDAYTQSEINQFLSGKATKATTLAGYGITDAYNSAAVDNALLGKADKATTLDGYKIPIATQGEAEALTSVDNAKPMTALRVAQSIAKRVVQAGESVVGISRFATLPELLTGTGGFLALCPAYILAGFAFNFAANGYIKLPSWLGGFMIQWATSDEATNASDYRFFPVPFPSIAYGAWLQLTADTTSGFAGNNGTVIQLVDQSRYIWTAGGTYGGGGKGFIIALGR